MRTVFLTCAIISSLVGYNSRATAQVSRAMEPLPEERLSEPIKLSKCPGLKVVEWRPSQNFEATTGPSEKAIKILNNTCFLAINNFSKFLITKNIKINVQKQFYQKISLIPALENRDGAKPRNLNDVQFRFSTRPKEYMPDGTLYSIWGFTAHRSNFIFIRNDVLHKDGSINNRFVTIFAHEIFHAMSWYYGLYQIYEREPAVEDEEMAVLFTQFIGLGR